MSDADVDVLAREGRELTSDPGASGDKTYGRKAEVEALARVLADGKCAVLLGPSGVGKTAIVQKLIHYLQSGRLPGLAGAKVWELSTVGLCSDTRYTGMQEDKIRGLLRHATRDRLVYVSDLWNLPTAGSYDTNPRGIYDLMRPGIEAGTLVLFGEMSSGRWERLCRSFPELSRDFVPIEVREPEEPETRDLLRRAAGDLGAVAAFEKAAIDRAYALAKKFLPTKSFPGKGIELLRAAAQAAKPPTGAVRHAPIDVELVEDVFAKQTGLPMHMLSARVAVSYEDMHRFLAERVLGQDEAVAAVADVLALYKTGLANPDRPAGVLLFVGPTGVGKTELAKATAEFLFGSRDAIFRVDLSEYKDYHSFEKLIGDPRQNKPGLLTDHVRRKPFTVVLLDEFEKGHPNVADLFLQVFDDGRLTDAFGETVSLRHALIILTSNVGSKVTDASAAIGFGDPPREAPRAPAQRVQKALEAEYRPEFLNRIDRVLVFHPLTREEMRRIARRELGKVYRREGLAERDLLVEIDDGVVDLLLERGFDPKYGARPLKRAIEETLVVPLARALLSSAISRFQLLRVARRGDGVAITIEETPSSRTLGNLERRTRVEDGGGRSVHVSLGDVQRTLAEVYGRLGALHDDADVAGMRSELAELESQAESPAFWERAFGTSGPLVRRQHLSAELRRFDDLRGRADLVRELCEASFLEATDVVAEDLATEFVRLERDLCRAERELVRFDEADKGDAVLRLREISAKEGGDEWVEQLASMYSAWARAHGYDVDMAREGDARVLAIAGPYAYGYLKGEHGAHRVIAAKDERGSRRSEEPRVETYLVRVEVAAANGAPPPTAKRPDDDAPIRTYDFIRSRGVRDRRTGHSEGDPKRVLAGRIEGFLEAFVDGEERAPAAEPA